MIPSSPLHNGSVDPRLSGGAVVPPDLSAAGFTPSTDHHSPKGQSHPVEKVYSRSQQRDPAPQWHPSNGSPPMTVEPPHPDMNGHGVKRAFQDIGDPLEDRRHHDPPLASPNGLSYHSHGGGYTNGHHPTSSWESAPEEPHMDLHHQDYDVRSDSGLNGASEPSPSSSSQPQPTPSTAHVSHNGVVRTDLGKRKRAFTNRTKTGCATCRRRKKKCDEGKPTCQNCARGGFECMGYSVKPALLGKDGLPIKISGRPDYWVESQNRQGRGSTFEAMPNQATVGMFDNGHGPRHGQPWQPPGVNGGESRNLPSISASLGFPSRSSLFGSQAQDVYSPLAAASSVLNTKASSSRLAERPEPRSEYKTAREIIADGSMVSLNDQGLADDRRVCTTNCYQFNLMAGQGAKELELRRGFAKIVEHGPLVKPKPTEVRYSPGKVGSSVSVEAPFYCDFGYNLQIGSSVRIDRNCTIKDFTTIVIGDRVQIGANVLISAQVMPPSTLYRGKARGMKIIIGSNCVIGDGVKITSDDPNKRQLRIGEGAYIGAGTHVTQDVPAGQAIGPCKPGVSAWVVIGDAVKPDDAPRQQESPQAPRPGPPLPPSQQAPRQPSRQGSLIPPPPPLATTSYQPVQPPLQSPLQSLPQPSQHQSHYQPPLQSPRQPPPHSPPQPHHSPHHSQYQSQYPPQSQSQPQSQHVSPQQSHHPPYRAQNQAAQPPPPQSSYPPYQPMHSPYQTYHHPLPSPKDVDRVAAI